MLLNLVRRRYGETPEFLSVGGIAALYTFEGNAGAGAVFPDGGIKVGSLSGGLKRSERPTISYIPSSRAAFQKGVLGPIDLASLKLLERAGWSWDRILRLAVLYMNQVDNATSAGGPTPEMKPSFEEFTCLAKRLRQLQNQRAIELVDAEREATPKRVPLSREKLDGDFAINAIKAGYGIKETGEGIFLTKDEKYLALVVHPRISSLANCEMSPAFSTGSLITTHPRQPFSKFLQFGRDGFNRPTEMQPHLKLIWDSPVVTGPRCCLRHLKTRKAPCCVTTSSSAPGHCWKSCSICPRALMFPLRIRQKDS